MDTLKSMVPIEMQHRLLKNKNKYAERNSLLINSTTASYVLKENQPVQSEKLQEVLNW